MAAGTTPDVRILVTNLGGASPHGNSAVLIRKNLEKAFTSMPAKINVTISPQSLSEIRTQIESLQVNLKNIGTIAAGVSSSISSGVGASISDEQAQREFDEKYLASRIKARKRYEAEVRKEAKITNADLDAQWKEMERQNEASLQRRYQAYVQHNNALRAVDQERWMQNVGLSANPELERLNSYYAEIEAQQQNQVQLAQQMEAARTQATKNERIRREAEAKAEAAQINAQLEAQWQARLAIQESAQQQEYQSYVRHNNAMRMADQERWMQNVGLASNPELEAMNEQYAAMEARQNESQQERYQSFVRHNNAMRAAAQENWMQNVGLAANPELERMNAYYQNLERTSAEASRSATRAAMEHSAAEQQRARDLFASQAAAGKASLALERFNTYVNGLNPHATTQFASEIRTIRTLFGSGLQSDLDKANVKFAEFQARMKRLGYEGGNAFTTLHSKLKTFASYLASSTVIMALVRGVRELINNVKELDEVMVDLRIVTGASREEARGLIDDYNKLAKTLGSTTAEVAAGATDWLRQGYTGEEANELLTQSMTLSIVGDMESEDATNALTSALKGYQLAVEDASTVVDKFFVVDMAAATSAEDMALALAKTAANAKLAGVSLNDVIGQLAVVNETLKEDGAETGTFYNTMLSRMGNIRAGNLNDPESGDDLSNVEATLSGLGIKLRESNSEFRNFGEVLEEVGAKWDEFSTVQQRAIATSFAGTRQQTRFIALMEGYTKAQEYSAKAADSAGVSAEKLAIYQENVEAKTAKATAAFEDLSVSLLNSKIVVFVLDFVTALLSGASALDAWPAKISLATLAIFSLGTAIKGLQASKLLDFFTAFPKSLAASVSGINALGAAIRINRVTEVIDIADVGYAGVSNIAYQQSIKNVNQLSMAIKELTPTQIANAVATGKLSLENVEAAISTELFTDEQREAINTELIVAGAKGVDGAATDKLAFSVGNLTTAIWANVKAMLKWLVTNPLGWITLGVAAIGIFIAAYNKFTITIEEHVEKLKELQEEYDAVASELSSLQDELDAANKRMAELEGLSAPTLVEQSELKKLKETNKELLREVELLKQKEKLAKDNLKQSAANTWSDMTTKKRHGIDTTGNRVTDIEYAEHAIRELERLQTLRDEAIEQGNPTHYFDDMIEHYETWLNENANAAALLGIDAASDFADKILAALDLDYAWNQLQNSVPTSIDLSALIHSTEEQLESLYDSSAAFNGWVDDAVNMGAISEATGAEIYELVRAINSLTLAAKEATDSTIALSAAWDVYDKIGEPFEKLAEAQEEMAESGFLSVDLAKELDEAGLGKYLEQTANGYKLTTGALEDYLAAQRAEYRAVVVRARSAAAAKIDQQALIAAGYNTTTMSIYDQIEAMKRLALIEAGNNFIANRVATGDTYSEASRVFGESQEYADISAAWDSLSGNVQTAEDSLSNFETICRSLRREMDDPEESTTAFASRIDKLTDYEEAYESLGSALSEFTEDGKLSADTVSGLLETFGETAETKKLFELLGSGSATVKDVRLALSDMAEAYLLNSDILVGLTEEERGLIAELLEANGVLNAHEVIANRVAAAQLEVQYATELAEQATWADVESFLTLEGVSGGVIEALRLLRNEQIKAEIASTDFTTATRSTVDALYKQALAAGASAEALALLTKISNLKHDFDLFNSLGWTSADGVAEQIALAEAELDEVMSKWAVDIGLNFGDVGVTDKEDKDTFDDAFEKEYARRKHLVETEQQTLKEFYDWLNGEDGYKEYYTENGKYAEEFYKYNEEVFNGLRDLYESDLDAREKILESLSDYDGSVVITNDIAVVDMNTQKIVDGYRKLIDDVEAELQRIENNPAATEYAQSLRDRIQDYKDAIRDTLADIEDFEEDWENNEHEIFMLEQHSGNEAKIIGMYREMQDEAHAVAEAFRKIMRESGMEEWEIEQSEVIQNLEKIWWDYEDQIRSVFDSIGDKIDDHINDLNHEIKLLEHAGGKEGTTNTAILAKQNELRNYLLTQIEAYTATLKTLGYTDQQIANTGVIQELQNALMSCESSIQDIVDDMNDGLADSMETILDLTIEMIEHEKELEKEILQDQIDDYETIVNLRKEMLQLAERERSYQEEVDEKTSEINKIQKRIDTLAMDDSRAAAIERGKLEEELAELQKDLTDTQREHYLDSVEDQLDSELDEFEKTQNKKIKEIDDFLDDQQALTQAAYARLDNMNADLFDDLLNYATSYTDTTRAELISMWNDAKAAASSYGSFVEGLTAAQNNSFYGSAGSSGSISGASNAEMIEMQINAIIQEMRNNSLKWHTVSREEQKEMMANNPNKPLAALISQLTGREVVLGADGIWYYDKVGGEALYKFHTGGVVGGDSMPTPKQNELFALLQKKEIVLNETQQGNLWNMLSSLGPIAALKNAFSSLTGQKIGSNSKAVSMKVDASVHIDGTMPDKQVMQILKNHPRDVANIVSRELDKL